jgi:hypothetical protein
MLLRNLRRRQREDQERQLQSFKSAGTTLGLTVVRRWPQNVFVRLEGDVDDRHIRYSYLSGIEAPAGSTCDVSYSGGPLGVKLLIERRTNRWQKTAATVGDESFDVLMSVKTSQADRMVLVLDAMLRRQILDLAFAGTLTIKDTTITLREQIKDPSSVAIVETVQALVSVAVALERVRSPK